MITCSNWLWLRLIPYSHIGISQIGVSSDIRIIATTFHTLHRRFPSSEARNAAP